MGPRSSCGRRAWRMREAVPWRWTLVVTWGGLRGALSMVLALGVDAELPHRELIVTMTFGVVLLSIVLQGVTAEPLLRVLKLIGGHLEACSIRRKARRASGLARGARDPRKARARAPRPRHDHPRASRGVREALDGDRNRRDTALRPRRGFAPPCVATFSRSRRTPSSRPTAKGSSTESRAIGSGGRSTRESGPNSWPDGGRR